MYDELIKVLRTCSDPNSYCEDCAYYEKCFKSEERFSITDPAADAIEELLASCGNFEAALKDSVEECEKLQQYVDLYKDLTEKSQKVATELKQQLQKSEEDNVNLTGWLAEENAKLCQHYIRNDHDRGDDSLCDKWMCEVKSLPKWIPVTERLPDCEHGAEIGNIEWISCGMVHAGCFGRGGKYRDAYFRTWTDAGEGMDAKDADYWRAVTLPEPPESEGE